MSIFHVGLDVGSTTVKLVVLNKSLELVYGDYKRHFSDVKESVKEILMEGYKRFKNESITMMVTGSGALYVTEWLDIPFIQEVVASTKGIQVFIPETDVAIELGGEDAKITYFGDGLEQRMNSICAGGTGSFIDQMASLLETTAEGLNNYAADYKSVYSIASRCGVFAKTDIQALINQGAKLEDISVSVLQAVVNQTISNLACGRPIRGKVAFLGGPLHFMPMLRERFIETLKLSDEDIIDPEYSQLYVAIGAAVSSRQEQVISFIDLKNRLDKDQRVQTESIKTLKPLFENKEHYAKFKQRHDKNNIDIVDPDIAREYTKNAYIGIDAGSTTTKAVVINEDYQVLYAYYGNNKGKPLDKAILILKEIYGKLPKANLSYSCATGYGEAFIKAALGVDTGEVETIAHYKGAQLFQEDVDFILDIGGQDMKAMKIENGVIDNILLNEACSSGCGSFIETFATSLEMSVAEFVETALYAKNPVDLGSRCTVFMNSMVKQSQKEGASIGEISAGLAYSVIKNTLQKVIKVRDPQQLGKKILVQGGTFYGDAILRSFELISGREAIRPNLAGLMGALGAAIIAKERSHGQVSSLASLDQLDRFSYTSKQANCGKCGNNCQLSINLFPNGKKYIIGNKCERGIGVSASNNLLPDLYAYKYKRTFDYEPLEISLARRGRIGIPRVLNIYENYPFWHRFFTELGFRVELSKPSSRRVYEDGISSIPSETACYPAKMVHGHIMDLVSRDIDFIFYPSVFYEEKEDDQADNHLNCPVVAGYSEVIKHNVEELKEKNINFLNPYISFNQKRALEKQMRETLIKFKIPNNQLKNALKKAWEELDHYRSDIKGQGEKTVKYLKENNLKGIVLGGRPYHIDPSINHGIPGLITSLGMAVLTEDSVAHLGQVERPIRVLDQWTYHSRLYRAASYVGKEKNLEMVQLNSFGCGLDAVTTDQVNEILAHYGKIYTNLKIDEISNLGAVKIRIRSLMAALEERQDKNVQVHHKGPTKDRIIFTKKDKESHTILMPQMAPIQFELIASVFNNFGYKLELLDDFQDNIINQGLKYVNNDACYPSILVIGQFIAALKSGKYDLEKTSLLISQTGGMCRASNYVGFLRKALEESGFGHVPVISLSTQGIEKNPGFKLSYKLVRDGIMGVLLGDLLMRLSLKTRPYEKIKNSTNILLDHWIEKLKVDLVHMDRQRYTRNINQIVEDFKNLETLDLVKAKVGIAGEILVKYHPVANNNLVDLLENEGVEVLAGDLTDFLLYCLYNSNFKNKHLGKTFTSKILGDIGIKFIEFYRKPIREALDKSQRFEGPLYIEEIAKLAQQLISLGNQAGEGWLLTGGMMELIEAGAENIVCVQPFGCLPNHITGKGMIKGIRDIYPKANIVPLDYDPGASAVNQVNRLKLMISRAEDNLQEALVACPYGAYTKEE